MANSEKRNSNEGMEGVGDHERPGQAWVGARQENSQVPPRGGGYQDNCNTLEFALGETAKKSRAVDIHVEMTIEDLRAMQLTPKLRELACEVGIDTFLTVWSIMGAGDNPSELRVYWPKWSSCLRYQRDKILKRMVVDGADNDEIISTMRMTFCEEVADGTLLEYIRQARRTCE